jgi:hypothetical protein
MNHVRVTTITGHEVEIPHEEAIRIAKSMHPQHHVDDFHARVENRNIHYHLKASENIKAIAERHGFTDLLGTEDEYKDLLTACLESGCDDIGDLIVESAEERIAHHHKEIYSE